MEVPLSSELTPPPSNNNTPVRPASPSSQPPPSQSPTRSANKPAHPLSNADAMDSDDITGSESGQAVGEVEEDGEMDGEEREKALKDKLMKGKAKAGEKKKKKDSDLMDSAIVDRWNEEFGDVCA